METLTWTALIAFIVTTIVTLFVHLQLVRHIYSKQKELDLQRRQIERDYEIRQKSQIVAELFALWIQSSTDSKSSRELTPDEYKRLNQLSYECGLWLSPDILSDLSDKLAHVPGAKKIEQILAEVRYHLNPESKEIEWTKIIHW